MNVYGASDDLLHFCKYILHCIYWLVTISTFGQIQRRTFTNGAAALARSTCQKPQTIAKREWSPVFVRELIYIYCKQNYTVIATTPTEAVQAKSKLFWIIAAQALSVDRLLEWRQNVDKVKWVHFCGISFHYHYTLSTWKRYSSLSRCDSVTRTMCALTSRFQNSLRIKSYWKKKKKHCNQQWLSWMFGNFLTSGQTLWILTMRHSFGRCRLRCHCRHLSSSE